MCLPLESATQTSSSSILTWGGIYAHNVIDCVGVGNGITLILTWRRGGALSTEERESIDSSGCFGVGNGIMIRQWLSYPQKL